MFIGSVERWEQQRVCLENREGLRKGQIIAGGTATASIGSTGACRSAAGRPLFLHLRKKLHFSIRFHGIRHTHTIDKMGTGCKRCALWVILETHPHSSVCMAVRGRAALGKGGHAGVYLPNNTCPRRSGGITRSSRRAATTWLPTQAWQWAEMWFHVVKCYSKAFGEKIHFRLRQHISPGYPC